MKVVRLATGRWCPDGGVWKRRWDEVASKQGVVGRVLQGWVTLVYNDSSSREQNRAKDEMETDKMHRRIQKGRRVPVQGP